MNILPGERHYFRHKESGAIVLGWQSIILNDGFIAGTVIFPAPSFNGFRPEQKLNLLAHQNEGEVWPLEEFEVVKIKPEVIPS